MVLAAVAVFGGVTGLGTATGMAAPPTQQAPPTAADFQRVQADLARVQQDLREQKQLIFQLMQMHDSLLKYMQMAGVSSSPAPGAPLPPPPSNGASNPAFGTPSESATTGTTSLASARSFVAGKVRSTGAALGETYVYLDGPKAMAPRSATAEVKQQGRQFVPTVLVVQVGTRVLFPNEDKVFHNVFSPTPGDAFDLGTLKAGDKPNPVVLLKPGHVEVFCNIHSRMKADILVVPTGAWTRVRPDGSFQLSGVPIGTQHIVLWGPTIKPVSQRVDVTPAGGTASFSADPVQGRTHLNKQGGAYESYEH
jgi:plastocyanin